MPKLSLIVVLVMGLFIASCGGKEVEEVPEPEKKEEPKKKVTKSEKDVFKVDDLQDGVFETKYPNGQLKLTGNVIAGKRSGLWVSYFENGVKQSENEYSNGVLEGKAATFYPNAQLMYLGNYKNGKYHGDWVYFNQDGTPKKKIVYEYGEAIRTITGDGLEEYLLK